MLKLKSIIVCLAILLVITGCSSNGSTSGEAESTMTIAYVGGLSGPTAAFGIPTFEAVEYAIKEVNENGGINGKTVKLVKEDDEGNPFKGQQAIDKFANEEIQYVISGSSSAVALSQVAKVKQNNMIAVSPIASDPKVVSKDPRFFVNLANNNQFGWSSAFYAAKEMGVKEVIAFVRDDTYGTSVLKAFKEKYEKNGGKIVKEYKYPIDAKDFNSYISEGINDYPNAAIFATGYAADSGLIAKQARAIGYDKPIFATNPISNPQYFEISGDASNNTYVSSAYISSETIGDETKNFIEAWKSKFNLEPNVYQVHGYDAVYILKSAIEKADSLDTAKVQKELLKIKDYVGASGVTSFNSDGSSTKPIYIIKWDNGSLKLEKTLEPGSY
ncbi:ABC transporter substrate-binding protein [Neobacillus niacini]|jgi:branched-chain amino acid transport system substrate-binding protein|uniref:ABC transporter substrate-binding protein n=1 Tax=Neobacillus niacini TaxID=86668 RepID=UPI001C8D66E9|nr:ABC transporter substrate-binding protein [Neobacillus niacini]MBY0147520.1 ABC transporter substrate-binding protein [Neobacillus niacini]